MLRTQKFFFFNVNSFHRLIQNCSNKDLLIIVSCLVEDDPVCERETFLVHLVNSFILSLFDLLGTIRLAMHGDIIFPAFQGFTFQGFLERI